MASSDKTQRNAVVVFGKIIATTVLTAIATWRLTILIGLPPEILDTLLLLGLPLIVFFVAGTSCLAAIAWIVGLLPVLITRRLNLGIKSATMTALPVGAVAILCNVFFGTHCSFPSAVAFLITMIVLAFGFWEVHGFVRPSRRALLAWEIGLIALLVLLAISGEIRPSRDILIFAVAAILVRVESLVAPFLVRDFSRATVRRHRIALSLIQGAMVACVLPFTWFIVAKNVGWSRAAVDIHLLPLMGVWVVVACLFALLGWLADRHTKGFVSAMVLVGVLWLASAFLGHGTTSFQREWKDELRSFLSDRMPARPELKRPDLLALGNISRRIQDLINATTQAAETIVVLSGEPMADETYQVLIYCSKPFVTPNGDNTPVIKDPRKVWIMVAMLVAADETRKSPVPIARIAFTDSDLYGKRLCYRLDMDLARDLQEKCAAKAVDDDVAYLLMTAGLQKAELEIHP